ncbi:MAG: cytochrome c3 family protein [Candidatus Thiodiazotropha endolucinida]|uniref:Cytochrome c3 family protein n=1 Tax=Candidatus Thiodiazotropha taylori TaxID=2792791 RepID=A0A9E4TV01_9GAMM|nr:cytochrome c3 family protein [Candidatus Thiodiazotropha taylori]MCG8095929.1 cytochrome c3 family protein [Candidatus Thiodiazotropha endolucinida]MCG7882913.1 cytochrome c3 family protein [Candidatus Thiodiazotropha taylori]MCG7885868.1 cytochrome c3 family protein [Candidatus Thiodiazotropha taylori]MCG7890549.1 cytochrome c3 family protein [Candidatus Thiodiazotropha taylori]
MMNYKLILAGIACALLFASNSQAAVRGSDHDLSAGGTAQATTSATTEVCVFCHTPHGSNTAVSAPLWNKASPATAYTRYSDLGTATLDGSEVTVGSVSLACLSCHDGTQAMDVVVNAPGSGGWAAAGTEIDAVAISAMTNTGGAPIPMLGTDLRNDHPISIAYAGGGCGVGVDPCTPSTGATADRDFNDAQHATINGNSQWWIDVASYDSTGDGIRDATGTADTREKSDMILYTRDFTGVDGPSVECGSCHDPHEETARPVSFLRIANTNSDVCLACHIK